MSTVCGGERHSDCFSHVGVPVVFSGLDLLLRAPHYSGYAYLARTTFNFNRNSIGRCSAGSVNLKHRFDGLLPFANEQSSGKKDYTVCLLGPAMDLAGRLS